MASPQNLSNVIILLSFVLCLINSFPVPEPLDALTLAQPRDTSITPPAVSTDQNATPSSNPIGKSISPLRADQIEYHVPNTDTNLVIRKVPQGRRMPEADSLQLLSLADARLQTFINRGLGDKPLEGGGYLLQHSVVGIVVHQLPGHPPATYHQARDMIKGLKACLWQVNYVESTIQIWDGDSPRVQVGWGTISFTKALGGVAVSGGSVS